MELDQSDRIKVMRLAEEAKSARMELVSERMT